MLNPHMTLFSLHKQFVSAYLLMQKINGLYLTCELSNHDNKLMMVLPLKRRLQGNISLSSVKEVKA